ncbi:hypothetical protein EON63_13200 [archaeon]|nr:MAG: hypothetical protein EON63_13200 [archaeon]
MNPQVARAYKRTYTHHTAYIHHKRTYTTPSSFDYTNFRSHNNTSTIYPHLKLILPNLVTSMDHITMSITMSITIPATPYVITKD